jgi:aminoacyl tRNA synthase complex-interacting multifunctional protein 2
MYRLENIHKTSLLPEATSLIELESRQVGILNQLSALKSRIQDLTRKFDVKMAAVEYNHVVLHASPKNVTKPIVIMLRHISKALTCHAQVYVHSGLTGETEEQLKGLLDGLHQTEDNAALRVTWIWKEGLNCPVLKASGQIITGLGPIFRYLARICANDLYENLGPSTATDIDRWIDTAVITLQIGNAKEKTAILRNMNSRLGKQEWLSAQHPTLSDIAMFTALDGHPLVASPQGNVKKWLQRCSKSLGSAHD